MLCPNIVDVQGNNLNGFKPILHNKHRYYHLRTSRSAHQICEASQRSNIQCGGNIVSEYFDRDKPH